MQFPCICLKPGEVCKQLADLSLNAANAEQTHVLVVEIVYIPLLVCCCAKVHLICRIKLNQIHFKEGKPSVNLCSSCCYLLEFNLTCSVKMSFIY